MRQRTFLGGIGSYTQLRQANNVTQGAYRPYMSFKQETELYQEIGGV